MKRVLLVNFTGDGYHWGCHGTSYALVNCLSKLGPVDFVPMERKRDFAISSVFESKAYGESAQFDENHRDIAAQLDASDIVVVNGEGTLHGREAAGPRALLAIMAAAKHKGKAVYLLNHSVFPDDSLEPSDADAPYLGVLSMLDGIATRDEFSAAFYRRHNVAAVAAFDCLPLFISQRFPEIIAEKSVKPYVVVTNGVNMQQHVFEKMLDEAVERYGADHKIIYLLGSSGSLPSEDERAVNFIRNHYVQGGRIEIRNAARFDEFLTLINEAKLLITGRFHYIIAAMCTKTPFLAVGSNTPKTDIVTASHGYDGEVLSPKTLEAGELKALLDKFDSGALTLTCSAKFTDLAELGARNFSVMARLPETLSPRSVRSPAEVQQEFELLSKSGRHAQLLYAFEDLDADLADSLPDATVIQVAKSCLAFKRPLDAADICRSLLGKQPLLPVAHANLLIALVAAGAAHEAWLAALAAEDACPQEAGVLLYAARAANAAGHPDDAIRMLEKAASADARSFPVRLLLAGLYATSKGMWQKCLAHGLVGAALKPEDPDINRIVGEAYLRLGEFDKGFPHYRHRLKSPRLFRPFERPFAHRTWDGAPLSGKLLVLPEYEQGVGFEILCATLIPQLEKRGISAVFEVSEKLIPVLRPLFSNVEFVPFRKEGHHRLRGGDIEAQAYFTEICCVLKRGIGDFPAAVGTDALLLPTGRVPRIGVSWSTTNPVYGAGRTIPISGWTPLLSGLPFPVEWVNLQYGNVDRELAQLKQSNGVDIEHTCGADFVTDLGGLMSRIGGVDAVVSIDNSTVFFAGLLRKPTLMMLTAIPHWIWGAGDIRSVWIPSIEMFRKSQEESWESVLACEWSNRCHQW